MQWETASGQAVPRVGQGTWKMGEGGDRAQEIAALQEGLNLGLRLVDTAEVYADGESEKIVAAAMAGRRSDVFLTTKVWPSRMTREGTMAALQESLRRLGTDYVDLYLQHWPSATHPLEECMEGLVRCLDAGLTRYIGVSNFPTEMAREAERLTGNRLAANQVLYNLGERKPEVSLVPWARERGVTLMAYSPIKRVVGDGPGAAALDATARRHAVSRAVVALAWVLRDDAGPMVTIPKAGTVEHVRDNRRALDCRLDAEDLARLAAAFPAPTEDMPLRQF